MKSTRPHARAARSEGQAWFAWACFGVYAFLGLESAVVAAVFRGPWMAMLAPAVVCMVEAVAIWRGRLSAARWATQRAGRLRPAAGRRAVASPGR